MGLEKLIPKKLKPGLLAGALALGGSLGAQDYHTGQVDIVGGLGNDTVVFTPADTINDDVRDSTYTTFLDANGQGRIDSVDIHKKNSIGLEETKLEDYTNLWQNPVSNKAWIVYDHTRLDEVNYHVFSLDGKIVSQGTNRDGRIDIPMNDLANGTYIVNVQSLGQTESFKVLKMPGYDDPVDGTFKAKKSVMTPDTSTASYHVFSPIKPGYKAIDDVITLNIGPNIVDLNHLRENWDTATFSLPIRTRNSRTNATIGPFTVYTQVKVAEDKPFTQLDTLLANPTVIYTGPSEINITKPLNNFIDPGAKVIMSTNNIIDMTPADSANPSLQYIGWKATTDSTTVINGANGTFNFFIDEISADPRLDESYVKVYVEELDPNLNASLPTNAIAVLTDTATGSKDTIFVNPATGWGTSSTAYPGGTFYHVDIGVPGGVGANGHNLKSYDNIPITINRTNYFMLASGDTTNLEMKVQLYPDSINTKNHGTVTFSAAEIDEFYKQTNVQVGLQDSLAYHLSNLFPTFAANNVKYAMDSINKNTSIITAEVANTIQNTTPYNPQTATFSSHGIEFIPGNGSYITTSGLPMNSTYGIGSATAGGTADVSTYNVILKEFFRGIGEKDVASRTSVLNGTASSPTAKDWGSVNIMYHISKAVHKNETQNVHPKYISDNTIIGN